MAGFSDYLENAVLNWLRGNAMPGAPASVYVGLYSAAPSDAGGGVEATTTIRPGGRVAVTFGAPNGGTIASNADADFGASSGTVTVSHFGLFDAAAAGNLLAFAALTTPLAITPGINVLFASGALTVSLD